MKLRTNDEILKGLGKREDYGTVIGKSNDICEVCGETSLVIYSKGGVRCDSCSYNHSKGYYVPRQWFICNDG